LPFAGLALLYTTARTHALNWGATRLRVTQRCSLQRPFGVIPTAPRCAITSDNIANVNTAGYVRRVVQQQTMTPGGQLSGVELGKSARRKQLSRP
jgi:hypothetical protein